MKKLKNFVKENSEKIIGIGVGVVSVITISLTVFKAGEIHGKLYLGRSIKNTLGEIAVGNYDDQLENIKVDKDLFKEFVKELLCQLRL